MDSDFEKYLSEEIMDELFIAETIGYLEKGLENINITDPTPETIIDPLYGDLSEANTYDILILLRYKVDKVMTYIKAYLKQIIGMDDDDVEYFIKNADRNKYLSEYEFFNKKEMVITSTLFGILDKCVDRKEAINNKIRIMM